MTLFVEYINILFVYLVSQSMQNNIFISMIIVALWERRVYIAHIKHERHSWQYKMYMLLYTCHIYCTVVMKYGNRNTKVYV